MGITKIDGLHAAQARAYLGSVLPTTPSAYYGIGTGVGHVDSIEWRGGEMAYNSGDSRFYIQTATSGATPTWKRLLDTLS